MAHPTAACESCGTTFNVRRKDHRYCSSECRLRGFAVRRAQAQAERDSGIRLHLRAALELLEERENRA